LYFNSFQNYEKALNKVLPQLSSEVVSFFLETLILLIHKKLNLEAWKKKFRLFYESNEIEIEGASNYT
jgi:hypothetical protein